MNALDIKYKTDYITLHEVGCIPRGTIVRRSKWVIDGLGRKQDKYHINNDEYSVVMHVKGSDRSTINWHLFEYDDVEEITRTKSLKLLVAQAQRDCPLYKLNRLTNTARRTTV